MSLDMLDMSFRAFFAYFENPDHNGARRHRLRDRCLREQSEEPMKLNRNPMPNHVWLGVVVALGWLIVATGCARAVVPTAAATPPVISACNTNPTDLALAVREQSQHFDICAQLADVSVVQATRDYVLAFVATPAGRPESVLLLGSDLAPIVGQAPACFAAVIESIGLARSGGGECPVTVPLTVPLHTTASAFDLPAQDSWIASIH
ncbi:MAG: hypothetical protein A2289_18940 [Deltaproteobacteria bacterium RIFOXYA12_FULL_58_15]|nr:MAG: hypothetical protein A2289_18940 [Deltaproteobacteria bacterium RIFOXYA12_FULL_58_15]